MGCVIALPCKLPLKSHLGISASCSRQAQGAIVNLALHSSKCIPLEAGAMWVCGQPEPQGSAQNSLHVLGASQCQPCRMETDSADMLMGLPAYSFLQQIWGQHEYKFHSMLWSRASICLQGLLAQDLLWANTAILPISCSWQ